MQISFVLQMMELRLLELDKRPRCGIHTRNTRESLPSAEKKLQKMVLGPSPSLNSEFPWHCLNTQSILIYSCIHATLAVSLSEPCRWRDTLPVPCDESAFLIWRFQPWEELRRNTEVLSEDSPTSFHDQPLPGGLLCLFFLSSSASLPSFPSPPSVFPLDGSWINPDRD